MHPTDEPLGSGAPPARSASSGLSIPSAASAIEATRRRFGGGGRTPPPGPPPSDGDEDDEGMLRMSFLQHLEELRSRLIKAISGALVAFVACIGFGQWLWGIISAPAVDALTRIGIKPPQLVS